MKEHTREISEKYQKAGNRLWNEDIYHRLFYIHGKKDFAEKSKVLLDNQKMILLNH